MGEGQKEGITDGTDPEDDRDAGVTCVEATEANASELTNEDAEVITGAGVASETDSSGPAKIKGAKFSDEEFDTGSSAAVDTNASGAAKINEVEFSDEGADTRTGAAADTTSGAAIINEVEFRDEEVDTGTGSAVDTHTSEVVTINGVVFSGEDEEGDA